ncbi:MAG: hypothetical protein D6786_01830 [Gammaproteobacteria bacterium]|nr:MAG: hypothetical protein D6786_01830 [Gammaproteobacteria bacterium]
MAEPAGVPAPGAGRRRSHQARSAAGRTAAQPRGPVAADRPGTGLPARPRDPAQERPGGRRIAGSGGGLPVLKSPSLLTRLALRLPLAVVLAVVAACWFSVDYLSTDLRFNTDTEDMLSAELDWRRNNIRLDQAFPQEDDTLTVVVEGATPDEAEDGALALAGALGQEQERFRDLFLGELDPFFRRNGLLYLDQEELERLADDLAAIQPLLARLVREPTLASLFDVLGDAVEELDQGEEVPIGEAMDAVAGVLEAAAQGRPGRLSWSRLMRPGEDRESPSRMLFVARPVLDYENLLPAAEPIARLRELTRELGLVPDRGLRVRLTGSVALAHDELLSVSRGAELAGVLSLVMVLVVLSWGLRSAVLVVASLATLLAGLLFTAAFAIVAVGELNLISVAFAVLYIGLGIDFAIHYCLGYREQLTRTGTPREALVGAADKVGGALALCALTTAVGFYAFIPTAYKGVAELGIIAGSGMIISLVLSLSLLPALLALLPAPRGRAAVSLGGHLLDLPQRHPRGVLRAALLLALAGVAALPWVRFDPDPLHLQDQHAESVQALKELMQSGDGSPLAINILRPGLAEAAALARRLEDLPVVKEAVTLEDLVPAEQDEKMAIIEDLQLLLGEGLTLEGEPRAGEAEAALASMAALENRLDEWLKGGDALPLERQARRLRDALEGWRAQRATAPPAALPAVLDDLAWRLLGLLPGRIRALDESLGAEPFAIGELPERIARRWRSADGLYRIEVRSAVDLNDNAQLRRFVSAVRQVAPDAADSPVTYVEAGRAVVEAFRQAFLLALALIAVLLLWLMDERRDVLLVLSPLLLASLLTAAATVLLGLPFNFANIIALPLLLGIGVDSGVHIVHRYHANRLSGTRLLHTSTARAVMVSALTTICSFGNLAFSPHAGTASMGLLLALGVLFTLACTLLVLPAILARIGPGTNAP